MERGKTNRPDSRTLSGLRVIPAKLRALSFDKMVLGAMALTVITLYAMVLLGPHLGAPGDARSGSGALLKPGKVAIIGGGEKLSETFQRIGYDLDAVRSGAHAVPRLLLTNLPTDFAEIGPAAERKAVFIQFMLPLILTANERILKERERLQALDDAKRSGRPLEKADVKWLSSIMARYGAENMDQLLRRVDTIPPSLAIAQAAVESGWGTSRFAREGNALFGQRTFKRERPGIVPQERDEGQSFAVRAFDRLLDAVRAYKVNLNTHDAYSEFRRTRAEMRAAGKPLSGIDLVPTLIRYSEIGEEYVRTIEDIIRGNNLDNFDDARFSDGVTAKDGASKGLIPEV